MDRKQFDKILEERVLLTDGAMGTEIYNKGFFINKCYEKLNLSDPGTVGEIHRSFVKAGADIIETNTFGANRLSLAQHGCQEETEEINRQAVKIVKKLRKDDEFLIAGSVGPTGTFSGNISRVDFFSIEEVFREQIRVLVDEGADLLILETFNSFPEIAVAVKAARAISHDIPIIASMTFPQNNETIFGESVRKIATLLSGLDIDVIGLNCSTGPQRALELLKEFSLYSLKKLFVMPNAGYPKTVNGRVIYLSSSELFGSYARKFIQNGANIIGGCCGTTPQYIGQMKKVVRQQFPILQKRGVNIACESLESGGTTPLPLAERSAFGKKLGNEMIISMEILPPKSPDMTKTLETVDSFAANFNAVNIPDGPRASARMGINAVSFFIEKEAGLPTITHYCCRDRNILGIQSDLMALHALGIRNILAVTGDPPKLGNYPDVTAVFDVDSIGLIKIISNLNRGLDIVGNEIGAPTSFVIGAGVNPSAENLQLELERLEQKIEAGAEFIMTQPLYETSQFISFYERIKKYDIPLIMGVSPLVSYKAAEFQHNEIPGMEISERVLNLIKGAQTKKEAREIGVSISAELLAEVKEFIAGVYFMAQGRISRNMSVEILKRAGLR